MHVFLGMAVIATVFLGIITKRMSPIVALIGAPFLAAVVGLGYSPSEASSFIIDGLRSIIPVTAMIIFAMLFFGVVTDAGVMDPVFRLILKSVGCKPARITTGTALLALLIHLDGSGSVTVLLTVPVMLPLYERLGMDRRILALVVSMAAGVNFLPWIAPMLRSSVVIGVPSTDIFMPLIPVQIAGLIFMFLLAYLLGKREEKRLHLTAEECNAPAPEYIISEEAQKTRRPRLVWVNAIITLGVIFSMIFHILDAAVAFMVGLALALFINYPNVQEQMKRLEAHARTALVLGSIFLSASAFVGIMHKTGMITAMSLALVDIVPQSLDKHLPILVGIFSVPLSLFFDPDSFYFGVLPVLAETYKALGGDPVQVARGAIMGVYTTGFAISPLTPVFFLLTGLCRISPASYQKFCFPYLWGCSIFMTLIAVALGIFPL